MNEFVQQFISQILGTLGDDLTLPGYGDRKAEAREIYNPYFQQQRGRAVADFNTRGQTLRNNRSDFFDDLGTNRSRTMRNQGFVQNDLADALSDLQRNQSVERGTERENLASLGFSGGLRNKLASFAEDERQAALRRTRTPFERQLLGYDDSLSDLDTQQTRGVRDFGRSEKLFNRDRRRYFEDFRSNRQGALEGYATNPLNFVNL